MDMVCTPVQSMVESNLQRRLDVVCQPMPFQSVGALLRAAICFWVFVGCFIADERFTEIQYPGRLVHRAYVRASG
jgi:hypothetical protein